MCLNKRSFPDNVPLGVFCALCFAGEIRWIKENVTFSMTLRDRYNEGTEARIVTGVKKERVTHTGLLKDHIWFFYLVSSSIHQVIMKRITASKSQGGVAVGAPCSRKHG